MKALDLSRWEDYKAEIDAHNKHQQALQDESYRAHKNRSAEAIKEWEESSWFNRHFTNPTPPFIRYSSIQPFYRSTTIAGYINWCADNPIYDSKLDAEKIIRAKNKPN